MNIKSYGCSGFRVESLYLSVSLTREEGREGGKALNDVERDD